MNITKGRIQKTIFLAGIIEIIAGLSHFIMPYFAYQSKGYMSLDQNEIYFITLALYAVGILLITLGILTIVFLKIASVDILFYYTVISTCLWLTRIILEALYPVNISLFHIEEPTKFLMPLLISECLLFLYSAIKISKLKKQY